MPRCLSATSGKISERESHEVAGEEKEKLFLFKLQNFNVNNVNTYNIISVILNMKLLKPAASAISYFLQYNDVLC